MTRCWGQELLGEAMEDDPGQLRSWEGMCALTKDREMETRVLISPRSGQAGHFKDLKYKSQHLSTPRWGYWFVLSVVLFSLFIHSFSLSLIYCPDITIVWIGCSKLDEILTDSQPWGVKSFFLSISIILVLSPLNGSCTHFLCYLFLWNS